MERSIYRRQNGPARAVGNRIRVLWIDFWLPTRDSKQLLYQQLTELLFEMPSYVVARWIERSGPVRGPLRVEQYPLDLGRDGRARLRPHVRLQFRHQESVTVLP